MIFLFGMGIVFPCAAAEPRISVKAEVDKAFITIGEKFTYTISIRHDPEVRILSNIPAPSSDLFDISDVRDLQENEGDRLLSGKKFVLTTFQLGEFILPPVSVEYRIGEGDVERIETQKIFITVESIAKGEEKEDIRGVKEVVDVQLPRNLITFGAGALIAVMMALLLWSRFRRRAVKVKEPDIVLTPEEEALMGLTRLADSDLLKKNLFREYYFRFSEILRIYLEKRFSILAVESTTFEILRDLKTKDIDRSLRSVVGEVLEAADLAKFAKWRPGPSEIIALNHKAREIVEAAKPREPVSDGV